ncbi:MAG: type IV toxin-antitoxin system AbiEi family antitoxin domain-containing protein [Candidatus Nanopelagicales bacterium]
MTGHVLNVPRRAAMDRSLIDDLARAQQGVVTYAQLCEIGVPRSTIDRWTRSGGPWHRILPGTYLIHLGEPTIAERVSAALLYAGAESIVTGAMAAHLHGIRNLPRPAHELPVHLLIPERRQRKSSGFALIERTKRLPSPELVNGNPVAPLPRAIFDATRRYVSRTATRALVLEAVQRHRMTTEQFRVELALGQRRWTAMSRQVGGDARAGSRSVPEAQLRSLVRDHGLPEPLWNPKLFTVRGDLIAQPDGYYEDLGIALEVDSRRHHYEDEADYEHTWDRNTAMSTHGIVVLRLTPVRIQQTPTWVVQAIESVRAAHGGRTPPDLIVKP